MQSETRGSTVEVFLARHDLPEYDSLFPRYLDKLNACEYRTLKKIKSERRYREYLTGHLLTRCLIAHKHDCDANEVDLHTDKFGKPFLYLPNKPFRCLPQISISHNDTCVAIAFSDNMVGIDIEGEKLATSGIDLLEIARSNFSTEEVIFLEQIDSTQLPSRFCKLWTIKESVLKAAGTGLLKFTLRDVVCPVRNDRGKHILQIDGNNVVFESQYLNYPEQNLHMSVAVQNSIGKLEITFLEYPDIHGLFNTFQLQPRVTRCYES